MKKVKTSADMSKKVLNGKSKPSPDLKLHSMGVRTNAVKKNSKNIIFNSKEEKKPVIKGNDIVIKFD